MWLRTVCSAVPAALCFAYEELFIANADGFGRDECRSRKLAAMAWTRRNGNLNLDKSAYQLESDHEYQMENSDCGPRSLFTGRVGKQDLSDYGD